MIESVAGCAPGSAAQFGRIAHKYTTGKCAKVLACSLRFRILLEPIMKAQKNPE